MQQQFNPHFITYYMKPFLKRIMIAVAKKEPGSEVVREFFMNRAISKPVEDFFNDHFFNAEGDKAGVPFCTNSEEDLHDRKKFLEHFASALQEHKLGEIDHDLGALRELMPTISEAGEIQWPPISDRKLYDVCKSIGVKFEHSQIEKLITKHPETAQKDAELLEAGKLLLAKGDDGMFSTYLRASKYKPTKTAVLFYPAVTYASSASTPANDSQEIPSNGAEVATAFQQHRAQAVLESLSAYGLVAVGGIAIDNNRALVKVKSKDHTMLVAVNLNGKTNAPLQLQFTYQDGASESGQNLVSQSFKVSEDKLDEAFSNKKALTGRAAFAGSKAPQTSQAKQGDSKPIGIPNAHSAIVIGMAIPEASAEVRAWENPQTSRAQHTQIQRSGTTASSGKEVAKPFTPVQNRITHDALQARLASPEAEARAKAQTAADGAGAAANGPNRAINEQAAAPKPKSFFSKFKMPLAAGAITGGGTFTAMTSAFLIGGNKGVNLITYKAINEIWLALHSFLPHIFT